MNVFIKNFFRTEMSVLTAKSVLHFYPNATINILCLYKDSPEDYKGEDLSVFDKVVFKRSKYCGSGNGESNPDNCFYFTEGINLVYEEIRDSEEKWLVIAEDHFFTTGEVLKYLEEENFDLSWARWNSEDDKWNMNASIVCFVPARYKDSFPMKEESGGVEDMFRDFFIRNDRKCVRMPCRDGDNYWGDGLYTNDLDEMRQQLQKAGIV